jgi:hypothetical protein
MSSSGESACSASPSAPRRLAPCSCGRLLRACSKRLVAAGRGDELFHPEEAVRSYPNFVNDFCRQLVRDPGDAPLSANRCRASFICDHLAQGADLSVLLEVAGIKEVESLLRYARHVDGAPASKAALRAVLATEGR